MEGNGQESTATSSGTNGETSTEAEFEASTPIAEILTRRRLQELSKEVDLDLELDENVEEVLLEFAEDYLENVIKGSCELASHRKATTLETKDVQTFLERAYELWVPGFRMGEVKTCKRPQVAESHRRRAALMKKTTKKH